LFRRHALTIKQIGRAGNGPLYDSGTTPIRLIRDGLFHAVEVGHLAEEPVHATFGARSVIADDVEDQRIVELTGRLDGFDQSADLRVGVLAGRCPF
jgi:hypothetical protein